MLVILSLLVFSLFVFLIKSGINVFKKQIPHEFVIGLGTNVGDKLSNLRQAVKEIEDDTEILLFSTSRIYKTNAVLLPGSPKEWDIPYFNAAIKIRTHLSPKKLLKRLQAIERKIGRPSIYDKWSPRVIDLDILSFEQFTYETKELIIPHPLLLNRSFVLIPLLDLEPQWQHPKYPDQNLHELIEQLEEVKLLPYPLKGTQIMGVINLNPISMSGENKSFSDSELKEEIIKMVNEGAEFVDIGAESTRPGAEQVSPEKEWKRLQLFLRNLENIRTDHRLLIQPKISIDTYHAETVKKLRDYDIDIINDVSGKNKKEIALFLKGTNKKYVLVHNTGKAGTNHMKCPDNETITQIMNWFRNEIDVLLDLGIKENQIIIDPGIGFGKTPSQTAAILQNVDQIKSLGHEVLVGHSRKASVLQFVKHLPPIKRDLATAQLTKALSHQDIDIVRVHNSRLNRKLIDAKISIVAAHQKDRGIGYQNQIPWQLREDKQYFKKLTSGHTIIMGRRTYESIGTPLDNRRNIVISEKLSSSSEKIEIYSSLQEALEHINTKDEVFIIGGERLFEESLAFADHLYLTTVNASEPVDRFYPIIDENQWILEDEVSIPEDEFNQFPYTIRKLRRKKLKSLLEEVLFSEDFQEEENEE